MSEQELASRVRSILESRGWNVYPETLGFDLYAVATRRVRGRDARFGDRIGIECKLRASWELLEQSLRGLDWKPRERKQEPGFWRPERGPNRRIAIVPKAGESAQRVFAGFGVYLVSEPRLAALLDHWLGHLPRFAPRLLDRLPSVKVEVPAGVPSPRRVSEWKIRATRLFLEIERGLRPTAEEIRARGLRLDHLERWLVRHGIRDGKATFAAANCNDRPDLAHPEVVAALQQAA